MSIMESINRLIRVCFFGSKDTGNEQGPFRYELAILKAINGWNLVVVQMRAADNRHQWRFFLPDLSGNLLDGWINIC